MSLKAVYRNGIFEPLEPVELEENEQVELEIRRQSSPPASEKTSTFASLQGIWSHLSPDTIEDVERGIEEMRQQTAVRLERIADKLDKNSET